jgi:hypothetical protein
MLANTPIVPAQELQALYKNQVAVPKGATNSLCALFVFISSILIVYKGSSEERYWRNTWAH